MVSNLLLLPNSRRAVRLAAQFAGLAALASAVLLRAQGGAVPEAPMVPMAPSLPDAAIVAQPLQSAASQEIIDERPSAQHIWIAGHWRWQENRYAWIAGRWELPPRAGVAWVEPRWERRGSGFVLVGGYWLAGGAAPVAMPAPAPVYATAPVPAAPNGPAAAPVMVAPPQQTVVYVDQAPPPPVTEVVVARPSPLHVWVGGYWAWRGGRHLWVAGHWELPPRERVEWIEPRWERQGNGYVFVEGFWRDIGVSVSVGVGGPGGAFIVREGPPPPRHERYSERDRPSPRHIWIAGYWRHDGRGYVWMSGHWDLPPRGYREWIEPRWEVRGGGYVFVEGHWR